METIPWRVIPTYKGSGKYKIEGKTLAADDLMQEVKTPTEFKTRKEAVDWVKNSLVTHLPLAYGTQAVVLETQRALYTLEAGVDEEGFDFIRLHTSNPPLGLNGDLYIFTGRLGE